MPVLSSPNKIFYPLALIYGGISEIRNRLYRKGYLKCHQANIPIICVGNATAGGSGKSPFVDYVCDLLLSMNRKPAILLRGYGGKAKGPRQVQANDTAYDVGDEAVMHFQKFSEQVPVVVASKRAAGAKFIEAKQLGDTIVLDDGYQHHALHRDLNILLLDASSEESITKWLNGNLLPAGWLREPLDQAIKRANVVGFIQKWPYKADHEPIVEQGISSGKPFFHFCFEPIHFIDLYSKDVHPLSSFHGQKLGLLTSIGSPQSFIESINELGIQISHQAISPDHHLFSKQEFDSALKSSNGKIVVTSKDAVKLRPFLERPGQVFVLEIKGGFKKSEQSSNFSELLEKCFSSPGFS